MIPDFKTYIKESAWGEMRHRSAGKQIRKEDDIDSLDRDGMYDYLISYYKVLPSPWTVYEIKNSPEYGRITVPISGNNNCTMYFDTKKYSNSLKKLTGKDWEYANFGQMVCINYTLPYSFQKGLLQKLEDKFTLKSDKERKHIYYIVSPKDGSKITNSFFIEVIDFILDNAQIGPSKAIERIVNESAWGEMRHRSAGKQIRKEDELSSEEKRQFISWYLRSFTSAVVLHDKYENSLDGFKKMLNSHTKLQIPTENKTGEMAYLISNWNDGDNIQQQVNDDIKKLEDVFPPEFKKEPGKSIHKTLLDFWNTLDIEKKKDIVYNMFENSEYQNELFDEYGDDVDEYDDKTLDTIWNQEIAYHKQAEYYLEYHKTNESAWGEMRRRSSGEVIRKEDEVNHLDTTGLVNYMEKVYMSPNDDLQIIGDDKLNFGSIMISLFEIDGKYYNIIYQKISTSNPEITFPVSPDSDIEDLLREHYTVIRPPRYNDKIDYIKPKDGSMITNKFFLEVLDFILKEVEGKYTILLKKK